MTNVKKVNIKDRVIAVKTRSELFGRLALIMQSRHVDLKDVFEYPLSSHSWPLSTLTGGLKKTNKAALMHRLEKGVEPVVETMSQQLQ